VGTMCLVWSPVEWGSDGGVYCVSAYGVDYGVEDSNILPTRTLVYGVLLPAFLKNA